MPPNSAGKDFYAILGIPQNAEDDLIKKSFRDLAFKNHPDRNPNDLAAEQRFKDINEAYQTLSNPQKRAEYDAFGLGEDEETSFSSTGWFNQESIREVFTRMGFGVARNASQQFIIHGKIILKLSDILLGKSEEVDVIVPEDQIRDGELTHFTHTFKVSMKIPPGFRGGNIIRTDVTLPTGAKQTLNIMTEQEHDPKYDIAPNGDLYSNLYVTYPQAVLGGTCTIELIDGKKEKIKIHKNSNHGQKLRIAGHGLPRSPKILTRGDLYFIIHVDIPHTVTTEQKECLENLQKLFEQQAPEKLS